MTNPRITHPPAPLFGALAAALLLAGCGGGTTTAERPKSAGAVGWTAREDVGAAIELLNKGDPVAARKRLVRVLAKQPNDNVAVSLVKQIDTSPEKLLGGESFAYVTRANDSMSSLAQRFLGNPMLFYALARYNAIAAPGTLAPGRTLRIPGRERREPVRAERPAPAPRAATHAPAPTPAPAPKPAIARPAPAAPRANPARAASLRSAGLEQMNRGAINRAVSLLAQASQLEPGNALIQRDLQRAIRIQRTVQARP